MDVRRIRAELRMGRPLYDLPLRVTFYARVSTDQDEQINSLENQVQYYTELIQSKPNWKFVPGYVDEGISGGSTKKRENFNRMIRDAKAGVFDFIITKEISRFSRSTLDSIQYTQELLDYNVGVFFQNDNINTLDTDSEFRLVIMAGVAQDEIRKLSERLKFGFRQAIKNGHVLGNDKLYGYDKKDCVLTVNEKEAEIIRLVFELYGNQRLGVRTVSKRLHLEHTGIMGHSHITVGLNPHAVGLGVIAIDDLTHSRRVGVGYGHQQFFLPVSVHIRNGKLFIFNRTRFPHFNIPRVGQFRPAQIVMDSPERPLERAAGSVVPVGDGGFRLGGFCRRFHRGAFRGSRTRFLRRGLRRFLPAAGGKKQQHYRQYET